MTEKTPQVIVEWVRKMAPLVLPDMQPWKDMTLWDTLISSIGGGWLKVKYEYEVKKDLAAARSAMDAAYEEAKQRRRAILQHQMKQAAEAIDAYDMLAQFQKATLQTALAAAEQKLQAFDA